MDCTITRVCRKDAGILAYIQTESWKAGFAGILPPDALERYTDLQRATAMYERTLSGQMGHGYLLRVENVPHCIAWWDKSRETDMPGYAELICIHSLPDNWRKGYGSRMMEKVLGDIAAAGYDKVMLWVFEENLRARRFYEKHGFRINGRTKMGFGAVEMCYEKIL